MKTQRIVEGKTELIVPSLDYNPGVPGNAPGFFNPRMEFSRSTSVCCLKVMGKRLSVCDALAASGARGLRYANEVGNLVSFFDINPEAVKLIKRNLRNLGVKGEAKVGDASMLMSQEGWDVVDLDPFAGPVPFLDAAARSTKKYTMITATDSTVLCGVYPKKCLRLYGALPLRNELCHEVGLRILVGKVVREFAEKEKAVVPLLSHASDHFFRVVGKVENGVEKADRVLGDIGFVGFCRKCGARELVKGFVPKSGKCKCGKEFSWYGPLWAGKLMDTDFCRKAGKYAEEYGKREQDFFKVVVEESKIDALPYSIHEMARGTRKTIKKTDEIVKELKKSGFRACKSHLGKRPMIRTDAGLKMKKFIF